MSAPCILWQAAAIETDWVQGLDDTAIRQWLDARAGALLTELNNHHNNAGSAEILGDWPIVPEPCETLPTIPYAHTTGAS